jgi:hypothetical protein
VIFCEEEVVVKEVDCACRPRVYCRAHDWDNLSNCFKNLDVLNWPNRCQNLLSHIGSYCETKDFSEFTAMHIYFN